MRKTMILIKNKNKRKLNTLKEEKEKMGDFLLKIFQKEEIVQQFIQEFKEYSQKLIDFEEEKISFSKLRKEILKIAYFLQKNIPLSDKKEFKKENIFGEGYSSNIFQINHNTLGKKIYKKKDDFFTFIPNQIFIETFFETMIQFYLYESSQIRCVPKILGYQKIDNDSVFIMMKKIEGDTLSKKILEKGDDTKWLKKTWSYIALLLEYLQRTFYFVHGDFHSMNVMITSQNKIYLIDFGYSTLKMKNQWITTKPNKIKLHFIPNNKTNYSKSMDLFSMFLHFFKDEENRKEREKLSSFFKFYDLLFQIPGTKHHLGELLIEYPKKWDEKEGKQEYKFIHTNMKDINRLYQFIDKLKKEEPIKYEDITNEQIQILRRRFEPLQFLKMVENYL